MKLTSSKCKRADALWRKHIWKLFGGKCVSCGLTSGSMLPHECHHLAGRSAHVRLKPEGGALLCHACHYIVHNDPNGKRWLDQLIEDRFPEWFGLLQALRHIKPHPYTQECLELDVEKLKAVTNGE